MGVTSRLGAKVSTCSRFLLSKLFLLLPFLRVLCVSAVKTDLEFQDYQPARVIRNCVSNGTGRPVEPFSRPDFQAVPAMSR